MIGQQISRYRILEEVGRGGMGIVYKAEDTKLHRNVALKFLSEVLSQRREGTERFLREARAAAALNHPNICAVYEIDEVDGRAFIAMEFVPGEGLDARIRNGPLQIDEIVSIATDIALGLREAHEKEIIHRDIKSGNIMLVPGRAGKLQAKITDFGLARVLTAETNLTEVGKAVGTICFMAPEQFGGRSPDGRVDIWALSVVIYEMLYGHLPFRGQNMQEVVRSILYEEPQNPSEPRNDVPIQLERIVRRGLAKDPDDRYSSVDEMLEDLRSVQLNDDPTTLVSNPRVEGSRTAPSIAVLPFQCQGSDEEGEFFSDGITEDIIIALTRLGSLRVAARNSAFQFKGETPDLREVGRRLNVENVLVGSIRRAGARVRITVQLSSVAGGYEIWSERFDRMMEDIFEIQDEISQAIANALKVRLVDGQAGTTGQRHTHDAEAYNHYLRGRYQWQKRTAETIRLAKESFERALSRDSNFALAHSGLADCQVALALTNEVAPTSEIMPRAKRAAMRAVEIDPTLAEAHASLAFVNVLYEWDWTGAERGFKRAMELNPDYATAYFWQAIFVKSGTGRLDEAEILAKRAQEIDPLSPMIDSVVGMVHFFQKRYELAVRELEHVFELDPNSPWAHLFLGRAHIQRGEFESGEASLNRCNMLRQRDGHFGYGLAVSGRRGEARKLLTELKSPNSPDHIASYQIALIHCGLGENDQALEWLRKAREHHTPQLVWLKVCPEFESLHSEPGWGEMLASIGLS